MRAVYNYLVVEVDGYLIERVRGSELYAPDQAYRPSAALVDVGVVAAPCPGYRMESLSGAYDGCFVPSRRKAWFRYTNNAPENRFTHGGKRYLRVRASQVYAYEGNHGDILAAPGYTLLRDDPGGDPYEGAQPSGLWLPDASRDEGAGRHRVLEIADVGEGALDGLYVRSGDIAYVRPGGLYDVYDGAAKYYVSADRNVTAVRQIAETEES